MDQWGQSLVIDSRLTGCWREGTRSAAVQDGQEMDKSTSPPIRHAGNLLLDLVELTGFEPVTLVNAIPRAALRHTGPSFSSDGFAPSANSGRPGRRRDRGTGDRELGHSARRGRGIFWTQVGPNLDPSRQGLPVSP